jgi:hypothetical protein
MIAWCKHSHMLQELESFDVAQLCAGPLHSDPEYHLACHKDFLSPGSVKWIVNWLWACQPLFAIPSMVLIYFPELSLTGETGN